MLDSTDIESQSFVPMETRRPKQVAEDREELAPITLIPSPQNGSGPAPAFPPLFDDPIILAKARQFVEGTKQQAEEAKRPASPADLDAEVPAEDPALVAQLRLLEEARKFEEAKKRDDARLLDQARRIEQNWDLEERRQLELNRRLIQARQREELRELETKEREQKRPEPFDYNLGVWLAGAGPSDIRECGETERRKICAIGYTVLVPTIFALIAASYAVSTLTSNAFVITAISIAWAAIILIVDRAIIATYSPFMKIGSKAAVITLRIGVAVLMGLTVSHPLTLLLFKDTINAQIEAERDREIEAHREKFTTQKKEVETRTAAVLAELDKLHQRLEDSYEAKFIRPSDALTAPSVSAALTAEEQLAVDQRSEEAAKTFRTELADLATRIQATEAQKMSLQSEVDDWQRQFESEINGQRSGVAGVGPRARSIQKDQLEWRRADLQRMTEELRTMASRRAELESSIATSSEGIRKEVERSAAERAARIEGEQQRIADMQRQAQTQQMASFLQQQDTVRAQIQGSIKSAQADKERLSSELATLVADEEARLNQLQGEPRKDMLSQTLALHHLFEDPKAGGTFALMAYLVLAGLFLAVDTMPILVKFTSKKGEFEIRREQVLLEAEQGSVFGNLPANLRELDDIERQELHKQVVTYYKKEQEKKILLKEKEVEEARNRRDSSLKRSQFELAKRDRESQIEMVRLAERELKAQEARLNAAITKIEREVGSPKKLKLDIWRRKINESEAEEVASRRKQDELETEAQS
jgi:hypothetical protein